MANHRGSAVKIIDNRLSLHEVWLSEEYSRNQSPSTGPSNESPGMKHGSIIWNQQWNWNCPNLTTKNKIIKRQPSAGKVMHTLCGTQNGRFWDTICKRGELHSDMLSDKTGTVQFETNGGVGCRKALFYCTHTDPTLQSLGYELLEHPAHSHITICMVHLKML